MTVQEVAVVKWLVNGWEMVGKCLVNGWEMIGKWLGNGDHYSDGDD